MKLFDIIPIEISSNETVYKTSYKNNDLISILINEINLEGSVPNDIVETYVTPYDMLDRYSGFRELDNILKNMFASFSFQYQEQIKNLNALHLWGAKHKVGSGQTVRHKHDDKAIWSGVFYLQTPEGSAPIWFEDEDWKYFPTQGDILFWKPHIYHSVGLGNNTEERIAIGFNYK